MLFVNSGNDDATTCAFSRGCWEVNGTAVEAVCGGLTFKHSEDKYSIKIQRKHDTFLFLLQNILLKNTGNNQ